MPHPGILLALAVFVAFDAARSNAHSRRAARFAVDHGGDLHPVGQVFHKTSRFYRALYLGGVAVAVMLVAAALAVML